MIHHQVRTHDDVMLHVAPFWAYVSRSTATKLILHDEGSPEGAIYGLIDHAAQAYTL